MMQNRILRMFKTIFKHVCLFLVFGAIYFLIECLWKGTITNYRIFLMAGCLGVLIGLINNLFSFDTSFILQCFVGTLMATLGEAILGYQWNIIEGLKIWNYSTLPFSFVGNQINLFFSIAWMGLSGVCIVLDDYLRYWLFKEEKPHYK